MSLPRTSSLVRNASSKALLGRRVALSLPAVAAFALAGSHAVKHGKSAAGAHRKRSAQAPRLLDYLATEFASFEETPLNAVDSAALCQLSMINMERIAANASGGLGAQGTRSAHSEIPQSMRLTDLLRAEHYETMFTGIAKDDVKELLLRMTASPRFRDVRLCHYAAVFDRQTHAQFAAVTITYKDLFAYVAFRGTDSSIVGWWEDFDMSFSSPVPAQALALSYLEAVAPLVPRRLYLGGHSKGANLAEFAALKAAGPLQSRMEHVFLHDGPGFKEGAFAERDYAPLQGRMHKMVPEDAFVGTLLHSFAPVRVVKSAEHGLQQHNIFFWEVDGRDFACADKLSDSGRIASDIARTWIASYTEEERRVVTHALFTAIELSGATDALDLFSSPRHSIKLLLEAARQVEGPLRSTIAESAHRMAEIAANRIGQSVTDLLPAKRREA